MEKFLIVEDHIELRALLELTLRKNDRTFFHTDNGVDALRIAHQEQPDIILLDIILSGTMDGYEVTRRLRTLPGSRSCPILILTAEARAADRVKAFEAGADEYIEKPFKLGALKQKIENHLRPASTSIYARKPLPPFLVAEEPPEE